MAALTVTFLFSAGLALLVFVLGATAVSIGTHNGTAATAAGVSSVEPSEPFEGQVELVNNDRYHVFWKYDAKSITFEVHVRAKGWVGFGLSPNGAMAHSDMVTGWVKDGQVYFQDRYASGNLMPTVDASQDWVILEGRETESHTILKFKRALHTCDSRDRNITTGTLRLMYAYSDVDPSSEDVITYHGSTRGHKSVALFNDQEMKTTLPENAIYVDFIQKDLTIPGETTTYWCHGFHKPDLKGVKHHLIRVDPVITPGNEGIVHHMLLYVCYDDPPGLQGHPEKSFRCFVPNMPWGMCGSAIAGWAVGGGNFYYPEHVGFPMGDANTPKYFRLEVHYDNPKKLNGVVDSSGLRLWFTPTLRRYDAGMLAIGQQVSAIGHILPGGYQSLSTYGVCSKECLEETMELEPEINIFATLLHMHLLGTGIRVHHYRDGVEKPYLADDMTYDFNYQELIRMKSEVKIMKGDNMVLECRYNTMQQKTATFGGLGTDSEMCLAFLMYYPLINLTNCDSLTEQESMAKGLNLKYRMETKFVPPISYGKCAILTEGPYANMTFTQYIDAIGSFPNEADKERFQNALMTSDVQVGCKRGYLQSFKADETVSAMPVVDKPYIPDVEPCVPIVSRDAPIILKDSAKDNSSAPLTSAFGSVLLLAAGILILKIFS